VSAAPPQLSPDGRWYWDGGEWRSAISPDGRWRFDGRQWVPIGPQPAPGGGGVAGWLIAALSCLGILVLTSIVVIVILLTMGGQIANVFSNVAVALNS
jgi:hypothetical protein